jgi:hypothetical protein
LNSLLTNQLIGGSAIKSQTSFPVWHCCPHKPLLLGVSVGIRDPGDGEKVQETMQAFLNGFIDTCDFVSAALFTD